VLLSMTGFGEARGTVGKTHVLAELRSVNNRHFKLTLRSPDAWSRYEPDLERVLREQITRGTVTLLLKAQRGAAEETSIRLNAGVVVAYWKQLADAARQAGVPCPTDLTAVLSLPGVVEDTAFNDETVEHAGPQLEALVREAAGKFQEFRVREGAAMAADMRHQCEVIAKQVDEIALLAPQVVTEYRAKLQLRIQEALKNADVNISPGDLLREVALFTDRSDISEEIVRLRSHVDQVRQLLGAAQSQGRKLEFMCQEMFREANTIGSKSNHMGVAHAAVEIKTAIERMREVVQNVE
jgi:uncharacterized protein (TIGR00255 family)